MTLLTDAITAITHGFIALDEAEAAALGAPRGETLSLWAAMEQRHGSTVAHIVCLGLWLVQTRHCHDQLNYYPMRWGNYIRAGIVLIIASPLIGLIAAARWIVRKT